MGTARTLLLLLPLLIGAETPPAAQLIGGILSGEGPYAIARDLCDGVGPRLTGSPGGARAEEWALAELRRAGLSGVRKEAVPIPRWLRGAKVDEHLDLLGAAPQELAVSALGGSIGTAPEGLTGELLVVHSFEELEALPKASALGRIVLWDVPMRRDADGMATYRDVAPYRSRGAIVAARSGATATLLRSLGMTRAHQLHTGAMRYEAGVPQIPAAAVTAEDAELLSRLASRAPVRLRLRLPCRTLPDGTGHNVLGEVPGKRRPQEVVLVGAHLDSWDLGQGAVDDGAGVAMAIAAARAIARVGAGRTLRVVLFANEENGLRGAKGYAEAHGAELPRHVAAIEVDSGAGRPLGFLVQSEEGRRLLEPLVAPLLSLGAAQVRVGKPGSADLSPLEDRVPQFQLLQDTSRYFEWHHSAADTIDKIDPLEIGLSTAALAVALKGLLDAEAVLPRPAPHIQ